jgi:hypothetical protein
MLNSSQIAIASFIVGRSESLPIIIPMMGDIIVLDLISHSTPDFFS